MLNLKIGTDVRDVGSGLLGWNLTEWQYKEAVTVSWGLALSCAGIMGFVGNCWAISL